MLDVIIRGGRIVDGSGRAGYRADIGITRDTISHLGRLDGEKARRTIDAKGLVVSPGFVDVHTHSDMTLLVNPKAESAVRQGVTTHVFPNCGMGLAPAVGDARKDVEERARPYGIKVDWTTVGEYYRRVAAARPTINVVPMVAQGTVRMAVMGYSKDTPSRAQLSEMKGHVEEAMRSGARGMCSGLRYVPSGYATERELVELAKVVKRYGGLYATHMRSEGDNGDWFAAIDEALAIGRGSGVPVQISHMKALGSEVWGKSTKALAAVRSAKKQGVDVMVDQYPYTASSSTMFVLFPQWSQEGGVRAFLQRVDKSEQGDQIRTAFEKTLAMRGGAARMTVSEYAPDHSFEGKTLAQIATQMRASPFETAVRLLGDSDGRVSMVFHTLEEPDVHRIFKAPFVMVASDGSALAPYGKLAADYYPHPRNYGCFPRVLGEFVRKKKLVTLETAVKKMTSLPAARFGLEDRGLLRIGWRADVVVFDPKTVADRATFERPREYPAGIEYVFVNGGMVLERGEHTGKRPGRVLFASGRAV
ncbi:MAG TPA: D-aminoacylase [Candidatus Limnocylindria bacterium]|nr:D-aminoacylase [Candidatus Limnocylindria bacterium]